MFCIEHTIYLSRKCGFQYADIYFYCSPFFQCMPGVAKGVSCVGGVRASCSNDKLLLPGGGVEDGDEVPLLW